MITDDDLRTPAAVADAERWTAHNYHPLPVVIAEAEGAWVTDVDGRRYLDCLAGYSALNFGHRHPALIAAAHAQLDRLTLTSRAFIHDQFADVLPGAGRAVRQGPGAADEHRRRGRGDRDQGGPQVGLPGQGRAGRAGRRSSWRTDNFHGRTTTIVSFSTDPDARDDFGPYTPGFRIVPYGDLAALRRRDRRRHTVAVLLEPIQGEAGVLVPPPATWPASARCAPSANVLFIADEIQSGLGRTGATFACDHEGVVPGHVPAGQGARRRHRAGLRGGARTPTCSACCARRARLDLRRQPAGLRGRHRGGPAAGDRRVPARAPPSWARGCTPACSALVGHGVVAVRGRGLWAGVDIDPALMTGRQACERLAERGVLAKDTHGSTIRLAPPLVITPEELDWAVAQLAAILRTARRLSSTAAERAIRARRSTRRSTP